MFLFIFESIGTSELILIGIIALIFLGPRKLPEIARKMGKIMAEFRNTTNEFKATWEREVNLEEEANALRTGDLPDTPVPRISSPPNNTSADGISAPKIKEIDPSSFTSKPETRADGNLEESPQPVENGLEGTDNPAKTSLSNKENWL